VENQTYILFFVLVYGLLSSWITYKIAKTTFFGRKQKIVNIIFTWLVPFVWGLLIKNIIKPKDNTIMTKSKRSFEKGKYKDNWKNLTGNGMGV
jgi:hypothetical protein